MKVLSIEAGVEARQSSHSPTKIKGVAGIARHTSHLGGTQLDGRQSQNFGSV